MSQEDYNKHYDATAAKGLCWNGCGRKANKYRVKMRDGKFTTVESLWCLDCKIKSGEIVDATEGVN